MGPRSSKDDIVGGATLSFDVHDQHPHKEQVYALLATVRAQVNALWSEVRQHNPEIAVPDEQAAGLFLLRSVGDAPRGGIVKARLLLLALALGALVGACRSSRSWTATRTGYAATTPRLAPTVLAACAASAPASAMQNSAVSAAAPVSTAPLRAASQKPRAAPCACHWSSLTAGWAAPPAARTCRSTSRRTRSTATRRRAGLRASRSGDEWFQSRLRCVAGRAPPLFGPGRERGHAEPDELPAPIRNRRLRRTADDGTHRASPAG